MDASGGVEAGLETAVASGRGDGHGGVLLHQQVRPRERRPDGRPRRAARGVRRQDRARSSWRSAPPSRSAATSTSSIARPGSWEGGKEVEIPIPDELADEVARRRDQLLEAAAEADDDVLTKYLEGEEISDAELEACLRKGVKESILAPVLVGSATKGIGLRGAARRDRPLPALPGRRGAGHGRRTRPATSVAVAARPGRPAPRPRVQDRGRPVRRPADLPARPVGHAPARRRTPGTRTAARTSASASCSCLHGKEQEPIGELKAGEIGAVAKLTVTETGDTLASQERPLRLAADRLPGADARRWRSSRRRRRDLDKMGPALQRMLEEEPTARVERSDDRRAGPARDGRGPHRGHHRAAQAQVRGRDRDPARRASPTGRRSGARPRSTAATRSRPAATACSATSGSSSSRTPAAASSSPSGSSAGPCRRASSRASRRASARRPPRASSPATRCPTSRRRSTTARSTPVDSNELSFKIAASMALKDGVHAGEAGAPRADHGGRGPRPRGVHGRGQPRPQRPPRPGPRAWTRDGGMQVITAHVPAGRAVHLRDRAALAHRRPGHVHARRSTTTRRSRRTSPRRSSRRTARRPRPRAATDAVARGSAAPAIAVERRRCERRAGPRRARGRRSRPRSRRARTASRSSIDAMPPEAMIRPRPRPTSARRRSRSGPSSSAVAVDRRDLERARRPRRRASRSPRRTGTPAAPGRPALARRPARRGRRGDARSGPRRGASTSAPANAGIAPAPPCRRRPARPRRRGRSATASRGPQAAGDLDRARVPDRRDDRAGSPLPWTGRPGRAPSRSTTWSHVAPGVDEPLRRRRPGRRRRPSRARSRPAGGGRPGRRGGRSPAGARTRLPSAPSTLRASVLARYYASTTPRPTTDEAGRRRWPTTGGPPTRDALFEAILSPRGRATRPSDSSATCAPSASSATWPSAGRSSACSTRACTTRRSRADRRQHGDDHPDRLVAATTARAATGAMLDRLEARDGPALPGRRER